MIRYAWAGLATALLVSSCAEEKEMATSDSSIVRVGDVSIDAADVSEFVASLPSHLRAEKEDLNALRQYAQDLVDREIMLLEAERKRIDTLPELEHILDVETNKRLVQKVSFELVDSQLQIDEAELREAYDKFDLGWEVWPAHILSKSEEDARIVIEELGKGRPFSEVAKEYSRADDAVTGGNLGAFFGQGDVVPALREASFFLDEGEYSDPIRTKDGWEVVKIIEKRRKDFTAVRGKIATRMGKVKWAERREAVVDSLGKLRDVRYERQRVHDVISGLFHKGLTPELAARELISYRGGRILVGDAVRGIRDLKKGALPPDSTAVFDEIERWILPDSLMVLEARAQNRGADSDVVTLREQRRRALMINQLRLDRIAGKVTIPDERVQGYYEEYLDTYKKLPGTIHLTEVLVEERREADRVLELARGGESLEALAVRFSVRPGMEELGGHAFSDSGRLEIASLYQSPYRTFLGDSNEKDVGVVHGPLEVQDRFSVFRLNQPIVKEAIPFKQVQRPIRVKLREQAEAKLFVAYLDSLRSAYRGQVEWNEDALARYAASR